MTFSSLLSLVSTLAIVAAGIFAGMQVRQFNRQRARDSALQLSHSFQTPEFVNAVNIVFNLPEGLSKTELENRDGDISLVEDFCGGAIVLAGRRFKRYLAEMQESSGRTTYYEWFQWLYERFEERESLKPAVPAFVAHRGSRL